MSKVDSTFEKAGEGLWTASKRSLPAPQTVTQQAQPWQEALMTDDPACNYINSYKLPTKNTQD